MLEFAFAMREFMDRIRRETLSASMYFVTFALNLNGMDHCFSRGKKERGGEREANLKKETQRGRRERERENVSHVFSSQCNSFKFGREKEKRRRKIA